MAHNAGENHTLLLVGEKNSISRGLEKKCYSIQVTHIPLQWSIPLLISLNTKSSLEEIFKAPCPVFSSFI